MTDNYTEDFNRIPTELIPDQCLSADHNDKRSQKNQIQRKWKFIAIVSVAQYDYCETSFTYSYTLNVSVRQCHLPTK